MLMFGLKCILLLTVYYVLQIVYRIHRTLPCPTKALARLLVLYSVKLATGMGEETNDSTVALYKLILRQMKFSLMHQMSMSPLNSKEYFQRLKSVVERQSPKVTFYYLLNVLNNFCFERLYASPFLNLDVRLRKQLWSSNVSGIELLILQFWS